MKLRHQRLMFAVVGCGATLALFTACSDDDVLTPSGSAGASGSSSGASGSSGASNTAGKGGAPSGGAPGAGAPSGGASSQGGAPSGGAPGAGAPSGGAATSGSGGAAPVAGAVNGGGAGEPAGGAAGASEAGAGGEAGVGGEAGGSGLPISIPLVNSDFEHGSTLPGTVQGWQTTGDPASYVGYNQGDAHAGYGRLAMYRDTPAYNVSTFQTVNGLTNGTYTLSAWVDGASSGLNSVYIYAKGYGSVPTDQVKKDITPATTYAQFSLTDIQVTSGTLTVGVYVDGAAAAWANVDDVTLVRVQ